MTPQTAHSVVEHLFRQEAGKLAASLARIYGMSRLETVEDIVQEALLAALSEWQFRGVPNNPTAWLHRVARNKAIDRIRRRRFEDALTVELLPGLQDAAVSVQFDLTMQPWEIEDSQLRMMFACCHPDLPIESQIALTLKTLCGFSVREIASAFLTSESTIEKRLTRARAFFRDRHVALDWPSEVELSKRIEAVLHSIYLLFNEGYKRTESDALLDRDLCLEAVRLALLLASNEYVSSANVFALVALLSFLSARFDARTSNTGEIVLLHDQNRSKWNRELIRQGFSYFQRADFDSHESVYHIQAAIQAIHMSAADCESTNWPAVLALYRRLFALQPNPIIALHMSIAVLEVHGAEDAIVWLNQHPLPDYYLFHSVLANAQARAGLTSDALQSYENAIERVKNDRERQLLTRQRDALEAAHG